MAVWRADFPTIGTSNQVDARTRRAVEPQRVERRRVTHLPVSAPWFPPQTVGGRTPHGLPVVLSRLPHKTRFCLLSRGVGRGGQTVMAELRQTELRNLGVQSG
jgi:hypothetical protein